MNTCCRLSSVALVLAIAGTLSAADEPKPRLENREIKFWVQMLDDSVGTGGGTTSKTRMWDTYEITATSGTRAADGTLPVKIAVNWYEGGTPEPTFRNINAVALFDTRQWDGKRKIPSTTFVAPVALWRNPVEFAYDAKGKLAAVRNTEGAAAAADPLLRSTIEDMQYFKGALPYHQRRVSEAFLKDRWEDLLIVDLPDDFDFETPWDDVRGWPTGDVTAVLNETRTAIENDEGLMEITTEIAIPRGKPLVTRDEDGDVETEFVKNGTGEGKTIVNSDGWVQSSDTTLHVYRVDSTQYAGFPSALELQFYEKWRIQVVRTENVK